jgi:hypothetical protein
MKRHRADSLLRKGLTGHSLWNPITKVRSQMPTRLDRALAGICLNYGADRAAEGTGNGGEKQPDGEPVFRITGLLCRLQRVE